jgi:hypothetical protein
MGKDEQRLDAGRSGGASSRPCMPLTIEVLTHLQVCLSSVELLAGMSLPAESFQAFGRVARAVDGLVAAVEAARRSSAANITRKSLDTGPGAHYLHAPP